MKKSRLIAGLLMAFAFISGNSMAQNLEVAGSPPYCEDQLISVYLTGFEEDFFGNCYDASDTNRTYWYKFTIVAGPGSLFSGSGITLLSSAEVVAAQTDWFAPNPTTVQIQGYTSNNGGSSHTICTNAMKQVTFTAKKNTLPISGLSEINAPGQVTYSYPTISGVTNYTWTVPSSWTIDSGNGTNSIQVTPADEDGPVKVITTPALNACNYPPTKQVEITDCFTQGETQHNFCGSTTWSTAFPTSGYGGQNKWPRMIGDFNGDNKDDVIGFGNSNVVVGLSNGSSFSHSNWSSGFVYGNSGATQEKYPRMVGDFTGDGKDDIIVFGHSATQVGVSTGSSFTTSLFSSYTGFTYSMGYTNRNAVQRLIGDFNGDNKDDIVGFGYSTHAVALSSGSSFSTAGWTGSSAFSGATGWSDYNKYPKLVGDFNNDGKDDIVGFGHSSVAVGISTGSSFSTSTWATSSFTYGSQGYEQRKFPRMVGDFNGDGKDDIIGFGQDGIAVGISTGSSFTVSAWLSGEEFTHTDGWNVDGREIGYVSDSDFGNAFTYINNHEQHLHEIRIADMNGDGMDDIVGFFDDGVYVSYSTGENFMCPDYLSGSYSNNVGFHPSAYIRQVGNFDNTDAAAEIIGFGHTNTVVMNCDNCSGNSNAVAEMENYSGVHQETGYMGWTVDVHEYCEGDVIIDVSGTTCEDRYFFEVHEFNLSSWTTTSTPYASGWIITNSPDEINLSDYVNFQTNKLYMVSFGVGPQWSTTNLWFEVNGPDAVLSLNANQSRWHPLKGGFGTVVHGYCTNVTSFALLGTASTCYEEYRYELQEVTNQLAPIGAVLNQVPFGGGWLPGPMPTYAYMPTNNMVLGKLYRLRLYVKNQFGTDVVTRYVERADCIAGPQIVKGRLADTEESTDHMLSKLYPNPTSANFINVSVGNYGETGAIAEVYTLAGQRLSTHELESNQEVKIDLGDLAPGTYYVKLISENHVETHSFVKQ